MWRDPAKSQSDGVSFDDVPDRLLRDVFAPGFSRPTHAPEYLSCLDSTHLAPFINLALHPVRHGNRADVSSFPDQVDDSPRVLAALNVNELEICELATTQ